MLNQLEKHKLLFLILMERLLQGKPIERHGRVYGQVLIMM